MITRRDTLLAASGAVGLSGSAKEGLVTLSASDASSFDLQEGYDALARGSGGTLEIPAGTFPVALELHSRRVHLRGAGRGATILVPLEPDKPVLRITNTAGVWDAITISDLTVRGAGGLRGVGLAYGHEVSDRYSGRTILRNIKFVDFDKCISRPTGNIGLFVEDCQFEDAAFHIHGRSFQAQDGSIMHNGVLMAKRCHFQSATQAVLFVRSEVTGSGQICFEDCLFENNPGFVLAVERLEGREGVPGISLRSCWNEANATGQMTNRAQLGGSFREPAFLFADRVASIELHDTPPGRCVLLGDTTMITRGCPLDFLTMEADASARLAHYDARVFGGRVVPGITYSVANANLINHGPTGAVLILPHRCAVITPELAVRSADTCTSPIILRGSRSATTTPALDAVLPGASISQTLAMSAGDRLYLNTLRVPPPGGFIAWTFAYRLVDGAPPGLQVTGAKSVSTIATLDGKDWTTIGGISYTDEPIDNLGFLLSTDVPATIRFGGFQLVCFSNRQEATEMLNDRLFRAPLGSLI